MTSAVLRSKKAPKYQSPAFGKTGLIWQLRAGYARRRRGPADWPQWACGFVAAILPGDRGLGDVLEHEIGIMGSTAFLSWWSTHRPGHRPPTCPACLNRRYPLPRSPAA